MRTKMNRISFILTVIVLFIAGYHISIIYAAEDVAAGDCGWDMTWVLNSDGVLTISGEGDMWDFSDSTPWKFYTRDIYEVTLEDGVESIGKNAFFGCTRLEKITIPDSMKSIKTEAFLMCSSLKSIEIPANVTDIALLAFDDCSSLEEITVSDQNPVYTSFEGILFSKDMKIIIYCPAAKPDIQEFSIPEGVTTIGDYAFYKNTVLKSVTFPSTLTAIYGNAFSWCTKLRSVTIVPSISSIGSHAFSYCKMLKTITIPATVKRIGAYVFSSCDALQTAEFLDGIEEIPDSIFYNCKELKSVYIPSSVKSIQTSAFSGCSGLQDVYYGGSQTTWENITFGTFNLSILDSAEIHYNSDKQ